MVAQYWRYALRTEVSTTSGRGCFELLQKDRQTDKDHTDRNGNSMTELAKWADSMKICKLSGRHMDTQGYC